MDLWPVLLILYGIELIVTRFLYEGKEGVHVTIDVGVIILIIFLVLLLGGISIVQRVLPEIEFYRNL